MYNWSIGNVYNIYLNKLYDAFNVTEVNYKMKHNSTLPHVLSQEKYTSINYDNQRF